MAAELRNLRWRALRLSKRGNADDEYEDASAADVAAGRFAVADGASEASFAGLWARVLVEGFVQAPGKPWRDLDWLAAQRKRWAEQVDSLSLPWYAQEKREQGAYATLLGLALWPARDDAPGRWHAVAVGDTCLLHARGGRFLTSFPLSAAAEFDNRPNLLGSRRPTVEAEPEQAHGRWQPQDRFLLMTDALAQWFLHQAEQGLDPLAAIDGLLAEPEPQAAFTDWIGQRRDHEALRNDDVTLAVIDVP
jgi:hypothetical protein